MPGRSSWGIALAACGHLIIELQSGFLPVLYPELIQRLGLSFTQVGVVAFALGAAVTLPQPLFGYLSDRWSPATVILIAPLWIGAFMGLVGLVKGYWMLLPLVVAGGVGSAAFHPAGSIAATLALQARDGGISGQRRGTAMSIFSVGGNVGAALSPVLVALAVTAMASRATLLVAVLGIPAALWLRWCARQAPEAVRRPVAKPTGAGLRRGIPIAVLVIVLVAMSRAWFQMSLVTYLPTWVTTSGGSTADGAALLFALSGSVGVGSLAGGWISDRVGRWQVVLVALAVLGPAHLLFLQSAGLAQAGLAVLMGILLGTTFPVAIVLAQEEWPGQLGLASGMVMGLGWLPAGIGASLTGVLADRIGLQPALSLVAIAPVVGAVGLTVFLLTKRGTRQPAT